MEEKGKIEGGGEAAKPKRRGRKGSCGWGSFTDGSHAARKSEAGRIWPAMLGRKTRALVVAAPALEPSEVETARRLGEMCGLEEAEGAEGVEAIAHGWFEPCARNSEGVVDANGLARTAAMVKFLSALCRGRRHSESLKESGLDWGSVVGMRYACRNFDRAYMAALGSMKEAMGNAVLETAFDLATVGADVRDRQTGEVVGKKKSEKMLDRLLSLSGREFQRFASASAAESAQRQSGGVTLTINIGGETQTLGGGAVGRGATVDV